MKNNITILTGPDGIKEAYNMILLQKEKIQVCCLSQKYKEIIGDFFETYSKTVKETELISQEIVPDNQENRTYAEKKDYKVRFLDNEIETDLIIGKDIAILISFDPSNPKAVVIRDKNLINLFTLLYDKLWENSKK